MRHRPKSKTRFGGAPTKLTLLFFAAARDIAGTGELRIEVPPGTRIGAVRDKLAAEYPGLKPLLAVCRFCVNSDYAPVDASLKDGDEIGVIPPVSGGSAGAGGPVFTELVRDPIDIGELAKRTADGSSGAILTFAGTVRSGGDRGRTVVRIEYEGYEPMAREVLRRIAEQAAGRFGARAAVSHRLGVLEVGEVSVGIAVSTPHRSEGFSALREIIEEIKKDLPVWKKEIFSDGQSEWVNCSTRAHRAHPAP